MLAYIEMIRPLNCLMSVIAVFIGAFLIFQGINPPILLGMMAVFLITAGGNIINDYLDVEADKVNRPKRPVASGKISKNMALMFTILLFLIGMILAAFINGLSFLIAAINILLLVAYSMYFQNMAIAGNAVVAYLVGSTFLFGGSVAINQSTSLLALSLPFILMLLSGLSTFSREIVKDLEDLEGDKISFLKRMKDKIKTSFMQRFHIKGSGIGLKYSEKKLTYIAVSFLILTVIISPLPYLLNILGISYLLALVPTDIAFALSAAVLLGKGRKRFSKSEKTIKIGMLFGLAAFIIGILI